MCREWKSCICKRRWIRAVTVGGKLTDEVAREGSRTCRVPCNFAVFISCMLCFTGSFEAAMLQSDYERPGYTRRSMELGKQSGEVG